ncbi:MAG: cation diffusion facilitator family transporter [Deferribacterales bacterium]
MLPGKKLATLISVNTAFMLAVVKLIGGVFTGSVSVLASAVDSILDIGSSTVNYFAIRQSEQPPDKDHRYGHAKFESLASLIQAGVITLSGLYILYEAYRRFESGREVKSIEGGIWIMLFSLTVTLLLVIFLRKVAKKENSSILKTESLHYEIDLLTGGGVLLGLVLVKVTGINAIDPFISVLIALKTVYSALVLGKEVSEDLVDKALNEDDLKKIHGVLNQYNCVIVGWHKLRTRKAGAEKFADLHVQVSRLLTIEDAHTIADMIEKEIAQTLGGADVQIHIEPCGDECTHSSCDLCETEIRNEINRLKSK